MKHIRPICQYLPSIKDKYYIAEDGTILVSNHYDPIRLDGVAVRTKAWRKNAYKEIMQNSWSYKSFPGSEGMYVLTSHGLMMRKMLTQLQEGSNGGQPRAFINLYDVCDNMVKYQVSRLVALCFIGPIVDLDVHHKDENPLNNHVSNLQILTKEEHKVLHSKKFND